MTKQHIPIDEFDAMFSWAETARTNEETWSRMLAASGAYGPAVQVKVARLVALVMGEGEND